jgi:hypothetical protein
MPLPRLAPLGRLLIVAALVASCAPLRAATPPPTRSVLFIGNSMIGKSVEHLRALAAEAGLPWRIEAVLKGGARLEQFAGDRKHDAFARIDAGGWTDVIIVQGTKYWFEGQTGDAVNLALPAAERAEVAEKTLAAALDFHRHIAAIGARTVLFLGYAHMPAAERTPAAFAPLEAIHWTMKDRLDAAVTGGRAHPTLLVPVGVLWLRGAERFGETVWYKNQQHGHDLAYYASACLFLAALGGHDPRPLAYEPGLPSAQAAWIKAEAWELSRSYARP